MNFMKRASLYLVRKKGRMLFLLLLLFLMSLSVLIGISFKKGAEKELDRLRKSMASGFTLKADIENELYREHIDFEIGGGASVYVGPVIHADMIEKICSIDGVKDYIGDLFGCSIWADLELKPAMWADTALDLDDPILTEGVVLLNRQEISTCPCRNGAIQKNFRTGALAIVEGRNIQEGDHFKAVVSDWMAEHNHLSIGDSVTLEVKEGMYQFTDDPLKSWGEPINLEIVGVFHANFNQESSRLSSESALIENFIYTDMDTYAKMREYEEQAGYDRGIAVDDFTEVEFLVEDPGQIDDLIQQIKSGEDLDLENMKLEVDNTDYQAAAAPYQQIRVFSMLLLALGFCGIGMILYLVMKLWVQGRRYEMGIFRSVGMKKEEILGQMLVECLMVSGVALVMAFVLSGVAVDRCATLAERMTAPRKDVQEYEVRVSKYNIPEITKTSSDEAVLDRSFSGDTVFLVILFVCGGSCISVAVSFAGISGLELKKLLM